MTSLRIGLVVPRFHRDILGGAELHARWLADHLGRAGHAVTVLTTRVLDASRWVNELPGGASSDGHYRVRRFDADAKDLDRWMRLDMAIRAGQDVELEGEETWLRTGGASLEMEEHLREEGRSAYDLVLGIPYMSGVTYFAFSSIPDRFCVIPCLHDEAFARLHYVDRMLSLSLGTMCNSWPELALARRLHPRMGHASVIGLGFERSMQAPDPTSFRHKYGVVGPFAVFMGRLELDKNVPQLLDYFVRWKERCREDLHLVLVGSGDIPVPKRRDVRKISLDWADRDAMLRAATVLFQPSLKESLSIVTMQAWLQGIPVLAHGGCEVVRDHCVRSNGGLWYENYVEFEALLNLLLDQPTLSATLGASGRAYVEREYSWPSVLGRFDAAVASWLPQEAVHG